jgi:hypothetical protein
MPDKSSLTPCGNHFSSPLNFSFFRDWTPQILTVGKYSLFAFNNLRSSTLQRLSAPLQHKSFRDRDQNRSKKISSRLKLQLARMRSVLFGNHHKFSNAPSPHPNPVASRRRRTISVHNNGSRSFRSFPRKSLQITSYVQLLCSSGLGNGPVRWHVRC